MDGTKSSQREKFARMSKNRRENSRVQSDDLETEMAVAVSNPSASSSTTGGVAPGDPGVVHRLTFRADPDLLEPKEKHKKLSRNEIEKLRRDRLNAYFMELAKLVPLVMQSNKKIDKASILRLTVAYLRIYHDLVKGSKRSKLSRNWRPDLTMHENLGNLLLESFGGFLLVINKKGILIFATEAITKYLGHSLSDVLGSEVKNVIHPNDYEILMQQFGMTESDSRIKDTDDDTDTAHVPVSGQRSFCIKMLNVLDPQMTCYELVHLVGHLKRMPPVTVDDQPTTPSGTQSLPEPSVCLVAVARLVSRQPIQDLYPEMDNTSNQWITRHELDGKITYSDQRGALLTGFLPGESIGFSPYSLLHPDDIASVVAVHNLFLENGCVPLTVFRMYTKSREILYIQTNTHMVIDSWTSKPKFIISINTVLKEEDGLLALADQNRRIEDKKRCAEVVQATCTTPSSSRCSSREADESSQSIGDPASVPSLCPPDVDCIIPEVEEVDDSTIDIVVGMRKFRIQMTDSPKFDPRSPPHSFPSISMVFDTHATKDDGGKSIPNVMPSFLSGPGSNGSNRGPASVSSTSSVAPSTASVVPSATSHASIIEPDMDEEPVRPSGYGSVPHRCVAVDDDSSMTELLLQKDEEMPDAGKLTENRDAMIQKVGGRHLLLRQLLIDRPQTYRNLRRTLVDGLEGVAQSMAKDERRSTTGRVSSLENTLKPRDETSYGEFSEIKSLLRDGHDATKRSASGIKNGGTTYYGDPDSLRGAGSLPFCNGIGHLATLPPSTATLPGNTAILGNVRRSSDCQSAAAPGGIPYHRMSSSPSGSTCARFSNDHRIHPGLSLDTNGTVRDGFTSYANGDGLVLSHQNGMYNGLEAQLRAVTSEGDYTNPSRPCPILGNSYASYLPMKDSSVAREMNSDSDVIHSSVSEIISRMPSVDRLKFLRHLIAEQEKVYTVDSSSDNPTTGDEQFSDEMRLDQLNGEENGGLRSAYATGRSSAFQTKQTGVDAVTLTGQCQDFGIAVDGGFDRGLAEASPNCWTSDAVISFDDSLFLAQQNDVSDWKNLVDDL